MARLLASSALTRETCVVPTSREPLALYRLAGGIDGSPEKVDPVSLASVGALELQHVEQWLKKEPRVHGMLRTTVAQFCA
jgi:hypothetical protein